MKTSNSGRNSRPCTGASSNAAERPAIARQPTPARRRKPRSAAPPWAIRPGSEPSPRTSTAPCRGLPLYEDLREKTRALPVAHGDETSWRNDGDNYFVWYGGNDQLAFSVFAPDRSGHTAQSIFGRRFSGILVSDAYAAYNAV
ncbi:MAG: IS66 family transposase, partial [Limisphaerales bacterium]